MKKQMTDADCLREMMANWNKVEAAVLQMYPTKTVDERYEISKAIFWKSLGLTCK